jgi:molybdopterin synthase catalytic subunit
MIRIQKEDFNLESEINLIKSKYSNIGAVSTFIGFVRNTNENKKVKSIKLEVYEEMAHKSLLTISTNAKKKWELIDLLIIHRYGNLLTNDKIVLVATFSMHRKNSIESCNYIMDHLKKDAPFWKKEFYEKGYSWL